VRSERTRCSLRTGQFPLNLELGFTCAKYPVDVSEEVLQALEDTLWDQLKPMFGRKGRR